MLNQQTIEKLHGMKMHGMADAFRAQLETTQNGQLSFEERFALLVDQQWLWKENRALARRLRAAHLTASAQRRDREENAGAEEGRNQKGRATQTTDSGRKYKGSSGHCIAAKA